MSSQGMCLGATAVAVMLAGGASASTVTVQQQGTTGSQISGMTIGGSSYNATGGAFTFNVSENAGGPLAGFSQVTTFCIELNEQVGGGTYTNVNVFTGQGIANNVQSNDGSAPNPGTITNRELNQLSWLFDNHFADVTAAGASANEIRAFQLLVWEIVYENTGNDDSDTSVIDLAGGNFTKSDDAVEDIATGWLSGLTSDAINSWGINENLVVLTKVDFQDQITMIPLPASALMGLAGLGGVLVARRRMRQA